MRGLVLKTGGCLEYVGWVVDDDTEGGGYVRSDVTRSAIAYLMDAVRFEGEIYLRDIFSLLEVNPVLLQVFARVYATEYLKEVKKRPAAPYTGEYDIEGIEYLELVPDWEMDTQTGELTVSHRLSIAGVGYVLQQDVEINAGMQYKAGTRIRWSIMYCPLAEILNLPLRFNGKVALAEGKGIGQISGQNALTSVVVAPSLAQIIQGALWEISFGGDAEQTAEFVETLRAVDADRDAWTTMTAEEFLGYLEAKKG